jgi:hypothetical protein
MDANSNLIANLQVGEVHESGIEDNALGVADPGDGLGHDVILCFTEARVNDRA